MPSIKKSVYDSLMRLADEKQKLQDELMAAYEGWTKALTDVVELTTKKAEVTKEITKFEQEERFQDQVQERKQANEVFHEILKQQSETTTLRAENEKLKKDLEVLELALKSTNLVLETLMKVFHVDAFLEVPSCFNPVNSLKFILEQQNKALTDLDELRQYDNDTTKTGPPVFELRGIDDPLSYAVRKAQMGPLPSADCALEAVKFGLSRLGDK